MRTSRRFSSRTAAVIALAVATLTLSAPAAHAAGRCIHAQGYTIICVDE